MSFFQETEIGRREGRKEYAKKMFSWENTVIKMSALRAVLSKSSSSSAASISNLIASVCSKKKKEKSIWKQADNMLLLLLCHRTQPL